jgi:NAD+ kinase
MIIALFPNEQLPHSFSLATHIRQFLQSRNITVVAEEEKAKTIGADPLSSVDPKKISFMISMGGDGTMLRISHHFAHIPAPYLGINLGHLGFMADVPVSDIEPSLTDLLEGKYTIQERLILEGSNGGKTLRAVNDIVIHRATNHSLVELAISIKGTYVNTFVADGIIIATPNGSTAYSLAAGGPILTPKLDALVLTPVCAHTISNRPLVLSTDAEIEIKYLSPYSPVEVRADGLDKYELHPNETYRVKKSKETFKLVNLNRHDYFATLRTKLGWSGKLK